VQRLSAISVALAQREQQKPRMFKRDYCRRVKLEVRLVRTAQQQPAIERADSKARRERICSASTRSYIKNRLASCADWNFDSGLLKKNAAWRGDLPR
jgi:hypothetical protein